MIYGVIGPNTFAARERVQKLISDFADKYGAESIIRLDASEMETKTILEATEAQSLFSKEQLIIIKDIKPNKSLSEQLVQKLESIPDSTHVLIYDTSLSGQDTLIKFIKNHGKLLSDPELSDTQIMRWLQNKAKELGLDIDIAITRQLLERAGANQWVLSAELEKLSLFGKEQINHELLEAVVNEKPQESVFELLDNVVRGDRELALKQYEELRMMRLEPQYIFSMLVWQAHNLTLVITAGKKDVATVAQAAKLSPFVVKKLQQSLHGTSNIKSLKNLLGILIKVDMQLKQSGNDADSLMRQLILKLTNAIS